ncbi:hypothetical protein OQ968_20725 [Mycobacterium sp. 663a-19]|uniref:hypothetical protein n=1 Tax=Mycobacterium sp. 663a-19 TaxID=2986148 RepID=UPI002D1F97C0|nr:hypothetical protein [Mycobacterium sp. 663a-19]MEB3983679.1 hypothetical protein [Mycobacterium sp. 663a-19]
MTMVGHGITENDETPVQDDSATRADDAETPNATVQIADPATVTPVPQGETTTVPPGATITLEAGAIIHVNSGSVTVVGGGARVQAVAVTINAGCAVDTLGTCRAGGDVVPANTRVTATSSPITLTQHRHVKAEVELVSGSATVGTGTHVGEAIVHAGQSATAVVGDAGASITNTEGTVAITTRQHRQLV